ncbi:Dyp-type peroxidase [Nocardioides ungokensis]|uniref:Dyp-type peroxidase n=1 Tax=Nocardioides ungokensis TaxID=1643322 RepID=UPI003CCC9E5F
MAGSQNLSRRGLIGGGVAAAGLAGAFVAGRATDDAAATPGGGDTTYAFRGEHQAGIVTPAQDRLHFAAFDVTTGSRAQLVALLKAWTAAADRMSRGLPAGEVGPVEGAADVPPDDTGEAIGLDASGLTITFGFGPSLFRDARGRDRFGLADRQPEALRDLPHFPATTSTRRARAATCAFRRVPTIRRWPCTRSANLARIGFGTVAVRWSQLGFGRTSTTSTAQSTPRNLFGFKDGTANVKAEETAALEEHVWVGSGDDVKALWLAGGSYLVARRINMRIEIWDRQPRSVTRRTSWAAPRARGRRSRAAASSPNPTSRCRGATAR